MGLPLRHNADMARKEEAIREKYLHYQTALITAVSFMQSRNMRKSLKESAVLRSKGTTLIIVE